MALKSAADGPDSPGPSSATSRSPRWGRPPGPSSLSGRSEAPENSETSPREKGNLGLPVLLTDGSTHLEQTVGSDRAALSQRNNIVRSRVRSSAACRRPGRKGEGGAEGAKVTGAEDLLSTTPGCCVLLRRAFLSIWSLEVGGGGRVRSRVPSLFFSGQMVRGETRMCWRGGGP